MQGISLRRRPARTGRAARRATVTAALVGVAVAAFGPWGRDFLTASPAIHEGRQGALAGSSVLQPLALATGPTGQPAPEARPPAAAPKSTTGVRGVVPLLVASGLLLARNNYVATKAAASEAAPAKPKGVKRIDAFDSIRFFLIAYIACGHFIGFAEPSKFAFKAITQINVVVGAFFALSGYVAAFTGCEIGEKKAKDRVTGVPPKEYIMPRILGYWTLHFLLLVIFAPMFIWVDNKFSGPITAAWHAFMSTTMISAWFPMHAEIWNAPTWFLGALTFATILTPFFLPIIAKQGKKELRRTAVWLTIASLLPKLAYCYDTNGWGLLEGAMANAAFKNLAFFNFTRFNPVWAVFEVMLGAVACRLVMLDGVEGDKTPKPSLMDTVAPFLGMVGIILLRATGVVCISDMLVRPLIFMPLFLLFLMGLHRASLPDKVTDPMARVLAAKPLTFLGGLSFPIFIVHGPLGQLFYKKVVANAVFGGPLNKIYGPNFFYMYLFNTLVAAYMLQKYFMQSETVKKLTMKLNTRLLKML
mmetsp:Transcript_68431/g.127702  ORF Transcript_68431/g.127702 Transcript_68431/m.127702 type:complete len:530 (+) Transcript_68431:73-1662(+)